MRMLAQNWPLCVVSLVAAVLAIRAGGPPIMVPDSLLYLDWVSTIPGGYPAFLAVVGVDAAAFVQTALAGLAAAALAWSINQARPQSRWAPLLAAALGVGVLANPQALILLKTLSSDSLFIGLEILFLAAIVRYAAARKPRMLAASAIIAGLAIAVRPMGAPLLLVAPLMVLLDTRMATWRQRGKLALAALLIGLAPVIAERLVWKVHFGDQAVSLADAHLLGKAALVTVDRPYNPGGSPQEQRVAQALDTDYAPVRELLARADGTPLKPPLLGGYETCIQHACSDGLRRELGGPVAEQGAVIRRVALRRLAAGLPSYLALTWDEMKAFWVIGLRSHPNLAPIYDRQVQAIRPLPFEQLLTPVFVQPSSPSRAMLVIRPAFAAAGVLVFLSLLALPCLLLSSRTRETPPLLAGFAGVSAAAGISLFTALTGCGDGRYLMGVWPVILVGLALTALGLVQFIPGLRGGSK